MGSFSGEGYAQAAATKEAGKLAAKASIYAANIQRDQYNQTRADMAPWLQAGGRALGTLEEKITAGPGEYEKSKDYDFLMEQGTQARERSAAARGGLMGGAEQKELTRFGQGLASQDYDKWLARWYQSLTPYQSMANVGQTTGNQLGTLGAYGAAQQGNFINQAGQYQAAGYLGAAQSIGNQNSSNMNVLNQIGQKYGPQAYNALVGGAGAAPVAAGGAVNYALNSAPLTGAEIGWTWM